MLREEDREGPPDPVLEALGADAPAVELRPDGDVAHLLRPVVVESEPVVEDASAGRPRADHDVGIVRLDGDVAALAAARRIPVALVDRPIDRAARHADRGVVLLRAVDTVGNLVVGDDVVELGRRLVIDRGPARAAVEGDAGAAVVPLDHPERVVGVDPERMVVAVGGGHAVEGRPAVDRLPEAVVLDPDRVRIFWIGGDVHVVPGAGTEQRLLAEADPGLAVVIGAEHGAVLGLDQCPDAAGLGRRDRDADLAQEPGRQARLAGDLLPGVTAVEGTPEPALLAAAHQRPGVALHLPDRREEDARVVAIHRDVVAAGVRALVEHLLPGLAAIGRAEDAALLVGPEGMAERRHVDDVRVARVDHDLADVAGVGEPAVDPGTAGIRGLVDAIAVGDVVADAGLAGADIDDVGVGFRHRDGTDSGGAEEAVGDVAPGHPAVGRLPDPASAGAEVEGHRVRDVTGDGDHPPAAVRADAAPLQRREQAFGDLPARSRHSIPPS
ncbi:hypothetical protein HRbin26_01582 [bacterium HR26]|nr:hypothetical protein HRbin26_01582 [bacterium HR26]